MVIAAASALSRSGWSEGDLAFLAILRRGK